MKQKIFSVTAKDLRWDYYNGTGGGGQNRNKNKNCVRVHHDPSGAIANCQDHKSREQNKKQAFLRLAKSKKFQQWLQLETQRRVGDVAKIESQVKDELLRNTVVETKSEEGKWKENKDLSITNADIKYME